MFGFSLPDHARHLLRMGDIRRVVAHTCSQRSQLLEAFELLVVDARVRVIAVQQVGTADEDEVGPGRVCQVASQNKPDSAQPARNQVGRALSDRHRCRRFGAKVELIENTDPAISSTQCHRLIRGTDALLP